jgi:anti-anti-sigma factor
MFPPSSVFPAGPLPRLAREKLKKILLTIRKISDTLAGFDVVFCPMPTDEIKHGSVTIVPVQGHLDTVTSPPFEERLLKLIASGERQILVDCSALDYINSTGLKAFLIAARKLEMDGGRIALCALAPSVLTIFQVIGFTRIIHIAPTCEDGLRFFAGEAVAA